MMREREREREIRFVTYSVRYVEETKTKIDRVQTIESERLKKITAWILREFGPWGRDLLEN